MYPIRFQPLFRQYVWGGRRLETLLGKRIGPGETYAESWEVVDHGEDQSRVAYGALAGKTLRQLMELHGDELLGGHHPQERFPLLLKFLDAHRDLSVQVHPHDDQAARLDPPDLGKTEAWYIIAADPGSKIYAGLKQGVSREQLAAAIAKGDTASCLHRFEPQVGDCVFIPAGTVHALGGGLVVVEIQQSSDTTYRLFDWNRVDSDGKSRPLHVEAALEVIDYGRGPVDPQSPRVTQDPDVAQLVVCDKFVLERWCLDQPKPLPGDNRFRLLAVIDGALDVAGDPAGTPLALGETMLVPAAAAEVQLTPRGRATVLVMYLP